MAKQRKTKKEKIKTELRRERQPGFVVREEWLSQKKKQEKIKADDISDRHYFRVDLTKTLILTMLVVALELALWQYLTRR